jgi:HlyD family type I secretion membrane fusion protein
MKLDFLFGGQGSGGGAPRRIDVAMFAPRPDPVPRPLDDASRVVRVGLIAAGAFFGLLLLFSLLAPISGAAVATGEVTTSGTRIVVQPEAGGRIDRIFVGEGQSVRAGQLLVRLNGVRSTAAAQQAQARRDALRALQARLIAERDRLDMLVFPFDLLARAGDRAAASAMAAQRAIFTRNRDVLAADRRIADTQSAAAEAQRQASRRQLMLINDELASVRTLYDKGYARKSQLRALERAAAQLQADSLTGDAQVARTRLESARLANAQVMQIVTQLGQVEEQLAQVDPALRVTQYDAARDLLRAPVDGRISGLQKLGPGSILGRGQTLMEIVPDGRALIVEARIKPGDIDDVRVGAAATLRFVTVNPHGRSSFDGKVVALSATRIAGENGSSYFIAQIVVDDPAMLREAGVELKPGVPVSVNVKTRDRTLFDYIVSPVADAFSTGFREE